MNLFDLASFRILVIYVCFNLVIIKLVGSQGEHGKSVIYIVIQDILIIIVVYDLSLILIIQVYVVLNIGLQYKCIAWFVASLIKEYKNRIIIYCVFMVKIYIVIVVFLNLFYILVFIVLIFFIWHLIGIDILCQSRVVYCKSNFVMK